MLPRESVCHYDHVSASDFLFKMKISKTQKINFFWVFYFGAPGRAHLLGGESPPQTRQGELLAGRQGCLS